MCFTAGADSPELTDDALSGKSGDFWLSVHFYWSWLYTAYFGDKN